MINWRTWSRGMNAPTVKNHQKSSQYLKLGQSINFKPNIFHVLDKAEIILKIFTWWLEIFQIIFTSFFDWVTVPHQKSLRTEGCVELRGFRCGTEGCAELRAYGVELRVVWNWGMCGTEGFLVWNRGLLGPENEWPFCVELMCWTEGDPICTTDNN